MKLPPAVCIPSDFAYKTYVHNGEDFIEISAPDGKFSLSVTVDLKRRTFSRWLFVPGQPAMKKIYKRHGWRDRLIADAVAHLQGAIGKAV